MSRRAQLIIRIYDPDDPNDAWEAGIIYLRPELFCYPEYREAVFKMAERSIGPKLEKLLGEIDLVPSSE